MALPAENRAPDLSTLDLDKEIRRLKRERNAVILAHYYQESEIQDLSDVIGDSLQLAQAAQKTQADVILFAGVHFMAETAKILNPERIVLVPDMKAGCSLADGCPGERFRAWKARYPGAVVVSYINCSAEVKAESDYIVTSSNAVKIVNAIPKDKEILFAPDKNLGRWVMKQTGRNLRLWQGSCIVHETFSLQKLMAIQMQHPGAKIIAHPECEEPLLEKADFIAPTPARQKYVENATPAAFRGVTERGIIHQMKKRAPQKHLTPAPPDGNCACNECPFMRLNTPEKVYLALRDLEPRLEMNEDLRRRALVPIERMLPLS